MQEFEYKLVALDSDPETAANQLNDYAYSGWRPIASIASVVRQNQIILERKLDKVQSQPPQSIQG